MWYIYICYIALHLRCIRCLLISSHLFYSFLIFIVRLNTWALVSFFFNFLRYLMRFYSSHVFQAENVFLDKRYCGKFKIHRRFKWDAHGRRDAMEKGIPRKEKKSLGPTPEGWSTLGAIWTKVGQLVARSSDASVSLPLQITPMSVCLPLLLFSTGLTCSWRPIERRRKYWEHFREAAATSTCIFSAYRQIPNTCGKASLDTSRIV